MEIVKCRAPISLDTTLCSTRTTEARHLKPPAKQRLLPQSIVESFHWSVNKAATSNIQRSWAQRRAWRWRTRKKGSNCTPEDKAGAGEMDQWVRGLPNKHEDLRADTQHPNKELGTAIDSSTIPVQDRGRTAGAW